MRTTAIALLALGAILAAPAAALAGNYDWPVACADSASHDKNALKLWVHTSYGGDLEVECGSPWTTDPDDRLYDSRFDDATGGYGAVEGFWNKLTSLIYFNRNTNYGACATFYIDAYFGGGIYNERVSVWVPKARDGVITWTRIPNLASQSDSLNSVRDYTIGSAGWENHNTEAECEADTNMHTGTNEYPAHQEGQTNSFGLWLVTSSE